MKFRIFILLFIPMLVGYGQTGLINYGKQADLLVKLLNYERNFLKGQEVVRIGLIYNENQESMHYFEKMGDAIFDIISSGRKVGKSNVSFSGIFFAGNEKNFISALDQLNISVLVVSPGNDKGIRTITRVAQEKGILTFSSVGKYLAQGIATGLENVGGQVKIVVNLNLSKMSGADFKAELLKIARVIR